MRPRWELPPPRELGWRLRRVEDAETSIQHSDDRRLELRIHHQPLAGVTLPMLAWWFQNFDRPCTYQGVRYAQMYLLWHPFDHHSVKLTRDGQGRVAPSQTIHIREAFGRDMRFAVDQQVTIHRWDDAGIGFHVARWGQQVFRLDHRFRAVPGGVQYDSCMVIGFEPGRLRKLLNAAIVGRVFDRDRARAWLRHNVEEVGCFEHFLPALFTEHHA